MIKSDSEVTRNSTTASGPRATAFQIGFSGSPMTVGQNLFERQTANRTGLCDRLYLGLLDPVEFLGSVQHYRAKGSTRVNKLTAPSHRKSVNDTSRELRHSCTVRAFPIEPMTGGRWLYASRNSVSGC